MVISVAVGQLIKQAHLHEAGKLSTAIPTGIPHLKVCVLIAKYFTYRQTLYLPPELPGFIVLVTLGGSDCVNSFRNNGKLIMTI